MNLLLVTYCDQLAYIPKGENFASVAGPSNEGMSIDILQIEDTLYACEHLYIKYDINLGERKFYKAQLYLDTTKMAESEYNNNQLSFYTRMVPDGIYNASLVIFTHSKTNSLLNRLELEYVYKLKEFILVIQNETPVSVKIKSVTKYNGSVKLNWEKYKFYNFRQYIVKATTLSNQNYPLTNIIARIDSVNMCEYIDSIHVGGITTYQVDVAVQNTPEVIGLEYDYNTGIPSIINWEELQSGDLKLTWNRCEFDSNFVSYMIYWHHYPQYFTDWDYFEIFDINDTTYSHDYFGFGAKRQYYILTRSKRYNIRIPSEKESIYKGNPIPKFETFSYNPSVNSLYLISDDSTLRVDPTTHEILANYPNKVVVSHDGTRAYTIQSDQIIAQLDPLTFSKTREIDTQLIFSDTYPNTEIFVGQPNVLYVNRGKIYYIDVDAMVQLASLPNPSYYRITNSSPHGYLLLNTGEKILEVDLTNPIINYAGLHVYEKSQIAFSYENNMDMVIDTYGQRIWTAKSNANGYTGYLYFDIDKEILYPAKDPLSHLVGGRNMVGERPYVIYDIQSQSKYTEVKTSPNFFNYYFYLFDSKIYSTDGLYMDIN